MKHIENIQSLHKEIKEIGDILKEINSHKMELIQAHKELTTVFEKTDLDLHECLDMLDKYLDISNKYLKSAIEELKTSNM